MFELLLILGLGWLLITFLSLPFRRPQPPIQYVPVYQAEPAPASGAGSFIVLLVVIFLVIKFFGA